MQQAIPVTRNIKIVTENGKAWVEAAKGKKEWCWGELLWQPRADFECKHQTLFLAAAQLSKALEPGCPVTPFRDVLFFGRSCPTSCFWVLMFFCVRVWEPMLEIVATVTWRIFKKNNESTSWPFSPPVWVWFSRSEWADIQPGLSSTALRKS